MAEYKDISTLKKQIADFKRTINSLNSDYMTGYVCALSVTEGMIAGLPAADVVEVVRCKDCRYFDVIIDCCTNELAMHSCHADDFCSYGERKTE